MIKSFKGKIADNGIQPIRLSTNDGLKGYRIVKFEVIEATPGVGNTEAVLQIFSNIEEGATASGTIDFDNPQLLGVAWWNTNASSALMNKSVIFDNTKFNQDIYITYKDVTTTGETMNYYIELEQVKLDLNEATVATLKDMRGRE